MGGFFNKKTIITVASVIYPMGEDLDKIPDMVKSAMLTASLKEEPVPRAIRDSIYNGQGVKLSQAWSVVKNRYYAGIPTGFPSSGKTSTDPVLNLLAQEYLEAVFFPDVITLHSVFITYETDIRTQAEFLVADEFDYDFYTEETLSVTSSVQLGASLEMTGPFYDHVNPLLEDKVGYHLVFTNPDLSVVTIDNWYDPGLFSGTDLIVNRIMMRYSRNGGRSALESYEEGGSSARMDLILRQIQRPSSTTFPCITLKKNNIYIDDDKFTNTPWKTSEAWMTSKSYAKRLGLTIENVIANVKDNESDDDIDYVFIQPGVRVASPNTAAIEYMYNYFNRLRLLNTPNKAAFDAWVALYDWETNGHDVISQANAENVPTQSIHIFDEDAQKQTLDMEIGWRWMTTETKTGVLPDGKMFEKEVDSTYSEVMAKYFGAKGPVPVHYETTMTFLRKQINDTQYEELAICGLRHVNYIYKGHSVDSGVWAAHYDDESDDGTGFILPLDYAIFITLSPRERLQLSQEALHIVFNCYVARKQKWYETGIFKMIMFAIMEIIIVISWGSATPYVTATYTAFFAALEGIVGATLAAALAAIITGLILVAVSMAISYAAKEAGEYAAERWGAAWGAVVQIITSLALSYGIGQLGSYGGVFSALSAFNVANSVLTIGTAVLSTMAAYTQYTYIALQDEIKTFNEETQGDNNPLEQVNKLLESEFPELSDIQLAVMPRRENLDEFLGRTLASVDALTGRLFLPISDFVELTLTPRL